MIVVDFGRICLKSTTIMDPIRLEPPQGTIRWRSARTRATNRVIDGP